MFTPASFSHLPGVPLRAQDLAHPSEDEVADHLVEVAAAPGAPVHHGERALALERTDAAEDLQVVSSARTWRTRRLVVASGSHHRARVPAFAGDLPAEVAQVHSRDYRRPSDLPDGPVLVVGAGNSGAEIALDLVASGRAVQLSGRDVGHLPRLGPRTFQLLRLRARVGAVVWATGFAPDFTWLGGDLLGADGWPLHRGGVSTADPRVGFVGLPLQQSAASHLLGGVGADAAHVVRRLHPGRDRRPVASSGWTPTPV